MKYYYINFNKLPSVKFAHKHETNEYDLSFPPRKNVLEISYIETGDVVKTENENDEYFLKAPIVSVDVYNKDRRCRSFSEFHRHFTVAVEFEYLAEEVEAEEMKRDIVENKKGVFSAVVPMYTNDERCIKAVEKLIKKIIFENAGTTESGKIRCAGMFLEIIGLLNETSKRQIMGDNSDISPADIIYSDRISKYIRENIDSKISRKDISEYIGISEGHMSRIFKAVNGCGITEYVNRVKINIAKQLLENKNVTLTDVSQSVGISDEKYFCRLFKKQTGMTVGEYKSTVMVESQ